MKTKLPRTWKEVGIDDKYLPYSNPRNAQNKSINALFKLFKIIEIYNEGWTPNWNDFNELKWSFYKYYSGGSWVVISDGWNFCCDRPSKLHSRTKAINKLVIKRFKTIIEEYFMI